MTITIPLAHAKIVYHVIKFGFHNTNIMNEEILLENIYQQEIAASEMADFMDGYYQE